ncbi:MAG: helix-turn-helix domain-containing protein [Hymenobacter sp.]|nr:MAG: helix-turn-helix domain-containing protein [Hymenobacter sp.]
MISPVSPTLAEVNAGAAKLQGVKVYALDLTTSPIPSYSRRDFYKICLVTGESRIHYADRGIELDGTYLIFANPHIPYSTELLSDRQTGYACLFTEAFVKGAERSEPLQQSPLFKVGGTPVFKLSETQAVHLTSVFQQMLAEQSTEYVFKDDLIRTYIFLLIHEALRMQPAGSFVQHKNASSRITTLFLDLLERLFPIDNPHQTLPLTTAQDFADQLAIHVNHLNKAVKEVTGRPTTAHIAERVVSEAKALLHHTDWDLLAIASSLGFKYPTYFTNFFKKHTGSSPLAFRKAG